MSTKLLFVLMAVFAFASFILLINNDSYHADKNNIGGLYTGGGIACALVAVYFLYRIIKQAGSGKGDGK